VINDLSSCLASLVYISMNNSVTRSWNQEFPSNDLLIESATNQVVRRVVAQPRSASHHSAMAFPTRPREPSQSNAL